MIVPEAAEQSEGDQPNSDLRQVTASDLTKGASPVAQETAFPVSPEPAEQPKAEAPATSTPSPTAELVSSTAALVPIADATAETKPLERRPYIVVKERNRFIGALAPDALWIMAPDGSIERQSFESRRRGLRSITLHPQNCGQATTLGVHKGLMHLWVSRQSARLARLRTDLSDEDIRKGVRHRFADFSDGPDGWKLDQAGRIKPWMNIRSEKGEFAISIPTLAPDLAFGNASDAEIMLRALGLFRAHIGLNFMVNPAVMFNNIIFMTHKGAGTLDLSASMSPKDFPKIFNTDGSITRNVWLRPLTEHERLTGVYIHVFDKNGMYLAAMSSLRVGFGIPEHITRPIQFRKNMVGHFKARVTPPASWPVTLPHPCFIRSGFDDGFQWQASPALVFALEIGCEIEIAEAFLFHETHRPFEPAYEILRDARTAAQVMTDEPGRVFGEAGKCIYTVGIGNLSNTRYRESQEKRNLHRPDWRHCVQSQGRANELRNIVKFNLNPFGIRTDAIYLVSASADPMEAAGGLPIGTTLRDWKHVMTLPLSALPREFFDGKAVQNPQHYLDAIKKVKF